MKHLYVALSISLACLGPSLAAPTAAAESRATNNTSQIVVPAGITTYLREDGVGLADARGMTLYSALDDPRYRTDPRFKNGGPKLCAGSCLEVWAPLLAPKDAVDTGDWSTTFWEEGARQWTYKNFPLFTYKLESKPGQTAGDGYISDTGEVGRHKRWRVIYEPMETPPGITMRAAPHILARVLADVKGMTAYTYDKDVVGKSSACVGECTSNWRPMLAPDLVVDIDKTWSTIRRDDGTSQWTFKGRPLYVYEGDAVSGEAKGDGIDKVWHAAVVRRTLPAPKDVIVTYSATYPDIGPVYADKNGRTFYSFFHDVASQLGKVCNAECMKEHWQPALSPTDVQGFGPWATVKNSDGAHQWMYQGKLVYTFVDDKKAGDMLGARFGYAADQAGAWGAVQARPPS
jgi:predicted lipoprotein with Yx(FWY)xxD motif